MMADEAPAYLSAPVGLFPPRPGQRPAEALHALAVQLRERGIRDLYGASCARFGVLSLPAVSVWTNGRVLWWRAGDKATTWAAADVSGAARTLAGLTNEGVTRDAV